ncbi:hypothetical protein HDK90DRAFT_532612 [Phyllosticta capitalensis]|uniref:Transmembrane protein n=1 Tax=Phyllosticta capitalensis TaxID=121624 RepID=A0ABR1YSJ6_9PEZI
MTAMWKTHWAIILLSLLVRRIVADDDNMFIHPTAPGPSDNFIADPINPGSGIQIKTVYTLNSNGSGDQYFDWTVDTYDTNITSSPAFFFWFPRIGDDLYRKLERNPHQRSIKLKSCHNICGSYEQSSTSCYNEQRQFGFSFKHEFRLWQYRHQGRAGGGTTTTLLWPQPTHLLPKTNTSNSHPSSNHIALKLFFGLIIPLFLIVVIALLVYFYRRSRASQVQPSDEAGTSADQQLPAYKQRPEEVGPEEPPPAYRP